MLAWIKKQGVTGPVIQPGQPYQGVEVEMNPAIWGPGIKSTTRPVSFVFEQGGIGDYINWCSALEYVRKNYWHVDGRIYLTELFMDVAVYLFGKTPRWKIYHKDDLYKYYENRTAICHARPGTQLINACGAHLMDVGTKYFLGLDTLPPEDNFLVEINYDGPWRWPELDPKQPFAIFTPGSTSFVREMPVKAFNELVAYTLSKGVTPVFLGKRELSFGYEASFLPYDLSKGIDLRERTNLLEATQLMRHAKFIIGIDNGLLHMAGTTDCPTIFGHNVAALEHRILRRRKGHTINITVDPKDLPCIGCQSRMRFMQGHNFKECFHSKVGNGLERACLDHLFKDDSAKWKTAIDKVLRIKNRSYT